MRLKFIISLIPFFLMVISRMNETFYFSKDVVSYKKWFKTTLKDRLLNPNLLFLILILCFFIKDERIIMTIFIIYSMILSLIINHKRYIVNKTKKEKISYFILLALYLIILTIMGTIFNEKYLVLYYLILGLLIYINDILIIIINLFNKDSKTNSKTKKKRSRTK